MLPLYGSVTDNLPMKNRFLYFVEAKLNKRLFEPMQLLKNFFGGNLNCCKIETILRVAKMTLFGLK